ncbi:MAG: hypothetical protein EOP93_21765 [Lysobacteraceae bacterium]|nr:MAG: hypothetical protein EOP93_21765 [Xanthomonadaceae bacterium]
MPVEPASSFALAFRQAGHELHADVTGRIDDVASLLGMFRRLMEEARHTRANRILLVDHTHGAVPPEQELRELAASLGGLGFDAIRLAYVDARGTAVSRMELGEIVGREHGFDVRVFDNESRARIWLHYGAA